MSDSLIDSQDSSSRDPLRALRALKLERIAAGRKVIDLSMINPDSAPARILIDKLIEASMKADNHRYSVARGIRRLREAFAGYYQTTFGVPIDFETEVCVTSGTKDALVSILRLLTDRGPVVAVAAPTYPMHRSAIQLAGMQPVTFLDSRSETERIQNLTETVRRSGARIVLLNYPNNPAGTLMSAQGLVELGRLAAEFDFIVVHDFVYGAMGFAGQTVHSFLSCPELRERTVETYSLSKAFNVPGWRVGAVFGPARWIGPLAELKGKSDYGVFLPLQIAAAHAVSSARGVVAEQVEIYERRAQMVVAGLLNIGCIVERPVAGASVWAGLPAAYRADAPELAEALLDAYGVALLPGNVFGPEFQRYVRIALVRPEQDLGVCLRGLGDLLRRDS